MPSAAADRMLWKKEAAVPHWMHFVDWLWMGAMMIVWLFLIAAVGYVAVFVTWRQMNQHRRPKSA